MFWPRADATPEVRLERYLRAATRRLPPSRRSEVAAELRDHVQARVSQLVLGAQDGTRALETALRELGPPAQVGRALAGPHPQPTLWRGRAEPDATSPYLAELRGVSHVYTTPRGRVEALRGVNLSLRRGEHLSVVGPAGSGKSVLVSLLALLERPTAGEVIFEGQDTALLSDLALTRLRGDRVGFVAALPNLLPDLTLWQNVALPLEYSGVPARDRRERAYAFLQDVGLSDRTEFLPAQVSTGQAQRAVIARALVTRPALVVADEPTAHLDEDSAARVWALLASVRAHGVTVVTATRHRALAMGADRVVWLSGGELSEAPPLSVTLSA